MRSIFSPSDSVLSGSPMSQMSQTSLSQVRFQAVKRIAKAVLLICHASHRTYNSVIGFNATRCSRRLGWSVSNPFCGTFRYSHFVPVSCVALAHH